MIKVVMDCFGGDGSPRANADGAIAALGKNADLYMILSGDEAQIKEALSGKKYPAERLEILHAPTVIGCDEKPTEAIRAKRDSSMMAAISRDRSRFMGFSSFLILYYKALRPVTGIILSANRP